MVKHVTRKEKMAPEEAARVRALREKVLTARELPEDMLEPGQVEFLPTKDFMALRAIAFELRRERERQGLALNEVAARAGMDPAVLSRLETGKSSNPTLGTLARVAAALGKELFWTMRDAKAP